MRAAFVLSASVVLFAAVLTGSAAATHPTDIPRSGWTVAADSQEPGWPATSAIDGNPATAWHSQAAGTTIPLPHTFTIDMHASNVVSGLRYLPRSDGSPNGNVGRYEIRVSADGTTWGNPVAAGTFADNTAEKFVALTATAGRFVRLTALSEAGNRGPWSSAAEINLVYNPVPTLPRTGWTVAADSQEAGWASGNAIDGNPATAWHSQAAGTPPPLPHTLTIDMHANNVVSGLRYLPRSDGSPNGNIGRYEIRVSADGTAWGNPIASGTFTDDGTEKGVFFNQVTARFVRLTALSEAGNRGPWSSAAEINLTNNPLSALNCPPASLIYTTHSNGAFALSQQQNPGTGDSPVAGNQQLAAWALDARRVAGTSSGRADVIYSAVNTGELRRRVWNRTTLEWEPFGAADFEVIDNNPLWASFSTPAYFNRITVDALGDFYTIESDTNLHWRRYNSTTRTWSHRSLGSGWDFYDMITAAGNGVIYARNQFGRMVRFEYDANSQRSRAWSLGDGEGWKKFSRIFSPGGDVLYGIRAGDALLGVQGGQLMWFRYNADTRTWANGTVNNDPVGVWVGTGWQSDYETTAVSNACQLANPVWPTRPQVTPVAPAPVGLGLSGNGHVRYSYTDTEGRAIYAEAADLTGGTPIRLAAVPGMTGLTGTSVTAENRDGRVQVVGLGLDADVRSNVQTAAGGSWAETTIYGGFFDSPVAIARWSGDRPDAFAVDQNGLLWSKGQLPGAWTRLDDGPNAPVLDHRSATTVVPPTESQLRIVGRDGNGTFYARSTTSSWASLGGTGFVGPTSAMIMSDGRLQVVATGSDGSVYTQRETSNGFSGAWTRVSAAITASGPASAILAPDGMIKVVVRATDGFVYYTSQTATGFDPWLAIPDTDESGTDPTALAVPASNTWVVAYRTDLDVPKLRRYVPGTQLAATSSFVDVPMTPPAA